MRSKKTIIVFLLMTAGVVGLSFTPWWTAAIWILVIAGLTGLNVKDGILSGGFAIAIVWILMARYMSLQDTSEIISKTGALMGGISRGVMMFITFLIAFITGTLSGWLGSVLGSVVRQKTTNN